MPFYIQFTKVKHFFELCKKSKENFIFLSFGFKFNILNSKYRNLTLLLWNNKHKFTIINGQKEFIDQKYITN